MGWHGAYTDMSDKGKYANSDGEITNAKDAMGGQFEIYRCSIRRLKKFFSECATRLEKKLVRPHSNSLSFKSRPTAGSTRTRQKRRTGRPEP